MSKDSALSRALARIDELEAENASLRGAVVVKPSERLVFIAPEHVSDSDLLQMFDDFYRRYVGQVIVLAHDWRAMPIDELCKAIEGSAPITRAQQAQESTKQKLANCEYCLGTGRAGRFVDELMGAKGGPCTVCNGRGAS